MRRLNSGREDQFEEEEEEWDPNKKHYMVELRRSSRDKNIALALVCFAVVTWMLVLKPRLVESQEWNNKASVE